MGAPKNILLQEVFAAFATKNLEAGLDALSRADVGRFDMKLFMRLLLERVRTVLLVRFNPKNADAFLIQFSDEDVVILRAAAKDAITTINAALVLRLLSASESVGKSSIPQLPLELALIEHCS